MDRLVGLIRSLYADRGLPPTPSAVAMRAWLAGPGRLQRGSLVGPEIGNIWWRPLRGGRWYVET